MSNFICSECGMTNIDCGGSGYKTPKEIELENQNADLSKKVERLQEQISEANEVIKKYRRFEVGLKVEKGTLTGVYPAFDYLKKWGVK